MGWWQAAVELLMPGVCPGCGALRGITGQTALCVSCDRQVERELQTFDPGWPFSGGWYLGAYDGVVGSMVRQGKLGRQPTLLMELGQRMASAGLVGLPAVDAVVPVPTAWSRRLSRGFEHVGVMCDPIARQLGLPVERILVRRDRGNQRDRGRAQRLRAMRGAFRCRPAHEAPARVLLVDDVCTTGATAAACGSELLAAGAREVHLLCAVTRIEPAPSALPDPVRESVTPHGPE